MNSNIFTKTNKNASKMPCKNGKHRGYRYAANMSQRSFKYSIKMIQGQI